MSANPSNVRSGWLGLAKPRPAEPRETGGDALQALFAFASLNQHAMDGKGEGSESEPPGGSGGTPPQQFVLDEVLQLVAGRALSITGADGIAIALAHDGAILCRASAGEIAPDRGVKLDPTSGFSGACLRSGETVRCDDSEIDVRVNAQACRALGARSMVAVPLSAKQRVIGLIEAFSKETYGFNDSDVRSLNLLGELILAAIRPEEEDRLAEISRKVIAVGAVPMQEVAKALEQPPASLAPAVEEPAPVLPVEAPPVVATLPTAKEPAKVILDEKFAPLSASPELAKPATHEPVIAARALTQTPEITEPPAPSAESAKPEKPIPSVGPTEKAAEVFRFRSFVEPPPKAVETPKPEVRASRSIAAKALVVAAVLVVVGLGWLGWQKLRHAEEPINADTATTADVKTPETVSQPIAIPAPPATVAKPGTLPEVTAIHTSATADSSAVVIDLEDQVQYEAHTLTDPDRIYFDLHDTKMAPGLANQNIELNNDPFLKSIRVAQPVEGVTRVVLDTKGTVAFTVSLDANPYRLNIELHKPSATPATEIKATPAPAAKPSPEISTTPSRKAAAAPNEFRVVIDAGHGGWDLGTVGEKGLLEKDLVLDISQRLGKLLEDRLGADVIYTREDDEYLALEKRAEIANLAKANIFVSVHANYSDLPTARGVETYYTTTYSSVKARTDDDDPQLKQVDWTGIDIRAKVTDSHRLAADVQQALYGALAARNPGIRNRGVKQAEYVVLTGTQMPAILAEVSFVSSPTDEDKLENSDYRQQIAEALYKGIAEYRAETKHVKLASAKKGN